MIKRTVFNDGMLVVTKCEGKLIAEELINSAQWMVDHYARDVKPGFHQIFDALEANTDAITAEDIHRIAHINLNQGSNRESFSMAILAMKPYPQALARLHKLLSAAANIRVEIFSDYDAAYQWLGCEKP